MNTTAANELGLTPDEIRLLNHRAGRIDMMIVLGIFAVATALGIFFASSYSPTYPASIGSAMVLEAQDFIADAAFVGAEITQDPDSGALIATNKGVVVGEYLPEYGAVDLQSEEINGATRYDVLFVAP